MSETKAVAVLLWLFELGRRGPNFRTGMNGLWWVGAVYLCLMLLSLALLATQLLVWVTNIENTPYEPILVVGLMLMVGIFASMLAAGWYRYKALAAVLLAIFLGAAVLTHIAWYYGLFHPGAPGQLVLIFVTRVFLAPALALAAASLLMGRWGRCAFALTYGLSMVFYFVFLGMEWGSYGFEQVVKDITTARIAWALPSGSSTIAAFVILAVYFLMHAAFLQPYLGDAARYFRNSPANVMVRRAIRKDAVDTLDQLHRSRDYDRIVVVAHSLGSVVAYDMLRAYYSRVARQLPVRATPAFTALDAGGLGCDDSRMQSRQLVRDYAAASTMLSDAKRPVGYTLADAKEIDAWLVTDFVTLGAALTHARYLMSNQDDGKGIDAEFENHIREREFPLCPPYKDGNDGLLSFTNAGSRYMHHGGLFGFTRWTNLYFPIVNIFWGDAIGGPIAPVFGACVKDVPVSTKSSGATAVFTHTAYWKTTCPEGRAAPHIKKLRDAVDLPDKGELSKAGQTP